MKSRIMLGRFLIRVGAFVQSLAVAVMRPAELVAVSRQRYTSPDVVDSWGEKEWVDSGLDDDETTIMDKIPLKQGRFLILGLGGGREAIDLARKGFEVTGVDFVSEMVEKAKENASRSGVSIEGVVQEFSTLDMPVGSYDIVWISEIMYSCIPTRKKRVETLKQISKLLKPGGYFVCQCAYNPNHRSRKGELIRKAFAFLTLGNFWYENGDALWSNMEFIHTFTSEDELRSEVAESGFEVFYTHIPETFKEWSGRTVLRKPCPA